MEIYKIYDKLILISSIVEQCLYNLTTIEKKSKVNIKI